MIMMNSNMNKLFLGFLLGLTILILPALSETQLYQYSVNAEIYNNNTLHYEFNIIFVNHPDQIFSLSIGSPYNIKVNSSADCVIEESMLGTSVVCNMKTSSRTLINIGYDSDRYINKRDNYLLFECPIIVPEDVSTLSFLVKLPVGTGLKEPVEDSYTPEGALIGSDGRRPILSWQMQNLQKGERTDFTIAFEKISETSSITGYMFYLPTVVIISGVVISFGLFYQFYWRGRDFKVILPILKKDEKIIFESIRKHGSGVKQKLIVKDSGYSKAKVSKVLKSLNERGIIKLERIGRTNKVYIEKNFEKKV